MREYNGKTFIEGTKHNLSELLEIIEILRSPNGCEWDKAQTHESLNVHLIEEANEVVNAVNNKDDENIKEELGDVLLQILLNAEIAKERNAFTFEDIIWTLTEKLIRRHPHIFGDEERPTTEEECLQLWARVKQKEKEIKNKKEGK